MSNFTQFKPKLTAGQSRYLLDGSKKIPGYMKAGGQAVSQSIYSNLYSVVGLVPDGNIYATWTVRSSATSTATISFANYLNNLFVYATQSSSDVATSTNATTWNSTTVPIDSIYDLTYGNGIYVLAGDETTNQTLLSSTDALTWTARTMSSSSALYSTIYGNGIFVVSGNAGALYTSSDATTWTLRTSGTASAIFALTYNPNATGTQAAYVYAGQAGILSTSTNAITWTARTSGTASQINTLAYGNNLYVYGGNAGILATSTDAITWTARTSGTTTAINSIRYFSEIGLWWYGSIYNSTVGASVASSTDAITWTIRPGAQVSGSDSEGVGYGINASLNSAKNTIFTAGESGVIKSAVAFTYDPTTSFYIPTTVNFTYTYLNTTPSAFIKKN